MRSRKSTASIPRMYLLTENELMCYNNGTCECWKHSASPSSRQPKWEVGMTAKDINICTFTVKQIDTFWTCVWIGDEEACWPWKYQTKTDGYATKSFNGTQYLAHRLAYAFHHGNIDRALTIDHLCRNRACSNPAHLEQVPGRVNTQRGEGAIFQKARQTSCIHGHMFTPENTIIRGDGRRKCRTCGNERARRYEKTEKWKQFRKSYRVRKSQSKQSTIAEVLL